MASTPTRTPWRGILITLDTMPKISPATQSVLDAYRSTHLSINNLAAALRAAANQLEHATSAHTLYAIADEFEGIKYGTYRCELKEFDSSDRVA